MGAGRDPRLQADRWGLDLESSERLANARVTDDGLCWWCKQRPATTAEHKYKPTDLRRMADLTDGGRPDPRSLYRSGATFSGELKTLARGTAVRWSKSMCKTCNGGRDRHMDAAYEVFSDYVWNHQSNSRPHAPSTGKPSTEVTGREQFETLGATTPSKWAVSSRNKAWLCRRR